MWGLRLLEFLRCRSSSVSTMFLLRGGTQLWLCIGWLRSFTCKTVVFRRAQFSSTWTVNFVKLTVGVGVVEGSR